MPLINIPEFLPFHKEAIFRLWNAEYPERLIFSGLTEVDLYLSALTNPLHYFATDENGAIIGWAISFVRGHETWFAVIISGNAQKQGLGKQFLDLLKTNNPQLSGWVIDHNKDLKINGSAYLSPLGFYLKNGFDVCPDLRLETEKLSAVKIKWPPGKL